MDVSGLLDIAKEFGKEYGPLLTMIGGVAAVVAIPFGGRTALGRRLWQKVAELWSPDARKLRELEHKVECVRNAFKVENELWLRHPIEKPPSYDVNVRHSIPILLVANLKGGVGKTTIAANLAAHFEARHKERVLAIDLDHQGSLSSMLLPKERSREERSIEAVKALIEGGATPDFILRKSTCIRNFGPHSRIIDCDDPFANFETQALLKWLIGDTKDDIRYNLARILHSEEIQNDFDRVIIDAPPRVTTGFVNALCASTDLVVPFVLDTLSAERVGLFLRLVKRMQGELFPRLKLSAVVGTMKGDNAGALRDTERRAIEEAKRQVERLGWHPGLVLETALIPRRQSIGDAAGQYIAYHQSEDVRGIFDRLGGLLAPPHLAPPPSTTPDRRGVRYESGLAGSAAA
jgi:cellulose biosynthesis protein BcsQ